MLLNGNTVNRLKPRKVRGTVEAKHPKISISFDWNTFNAISSLAERRKVTFSSIVREMVANGMRE